MKSIANCVKYDLLSSSFKYLNFLSLPCTSNCLAIDVVDNFTYLGITFDSKLNWQLHIKSLKNYFISIIRHFFHLRNCSNRLLLKIYYGIFHSKLQYGITCCVGDWGGSYSSNIQSLLVAQKHVINHLQKKSFT